MYSLIFLKNGQFLVIKLVQFRRDKFFWCLEQMTSLCLGLINTISFTIKRIINTDKGGKKPAWIKHPRDWEWSVGLHYSFPTAKMNIQYLYWTNCLHMINTISYSPIKKKIIAPLIKKNPSSWIYEASMGLSGKCAFLQLKWTDTRW